MQKLQKSNSQKRNKNIRAKGNVRSVSFPTSIARQVRMTEPVIRNTNGATTISHTEFIYDVNGSVLFTAFKQGINPGNAKMFPWLSSIAHRFESYRFKSLKFTYEPSVSTLTAGVIQLAVDYDVLDSIPASKDELMSNRHAVRTSPYASCVYSLDEKDSSTLGTRRFVRNISTYPVGSDPKTYDVGAFIHAASGFAAPITAGELYVSYQVELITPQLDYSVDAVAQSTHVQSGGAVSKAAVLGTAPTFAGGLFLTTGPNSITLGRPGEYLMVFYAGGTGTVAPTVSVDLGGQITDEYKVIDATSTGIASVMTVKTVAGSSTITFDYSASTTISNFFVRLASYSYALS